MTNEAARILVVDDAADLRLLIREVLTRSGVDVDEATTGTEALRRLSSPDPPAAVILDVQMPDMDGWETLAAIRRCRREDVGVILCTVRSQPNDAVRAYELGCDEYITKPFNIHDLAATAITVAGLRPEERPPRRARELAAARADLDRRADRWR